MSARHLVVCVAVAVCACGAEEESIASIGVLDESTGSDVVDAVEDATDAVDTHDANGANAADDPDAPRADAADDRTGDGDACFDDVIPVDGTACDCYGRFFYVMDERSCAVSVECYWTVEGDRLEWSTIRDQSCDYPDQWGRDYDAID